MPRLPEIVTGSTWREQAASHPSAIIQGLLPAQCLAFIAGEPGVGKSWLLWDLALSVTSGTDFLGQYPVTLPGSTMVIASEGDQFASVGRATALARGKQLDEVEAIDAMHFLWRTDFRLTDAEHVRHVAEHIRAHDIRLVLIDTLHGAWGGRENDAEAWSEVIRTGIRPLLAAGATVAVVHHTAKTTDSTSARTGGQRLRGSSAMHGSRDCLLVLARAGGKRDPHVQVTVELRDDAPVRPFGFNTPAPEQHVGAGDTFALEWRSLESSGAPASDLELRQHIIDVVARQDGRLSRNVIADQVGGRRQRVYAAVAALVEEGRLTIGPAPAFPVSLAVGKPWEQVRNSDGNTLPDVVGVPGVPLVEGTEHAEHLASLPAAVAPRPSVTT